MVNNMLCENTATNASINSFEFCRVFKCFVLNLGGSNELNKFCVSLVSKQFIESRLPFNQPSIKILKHLSTRNW